MRNRIERLRLWLLVGVGVLVLVLAVFIGMARSRMHHFLAKLPAKLGVDIKSETNGFTYSQSLQGKTIYTIHASKEVEHTDGKITLHDVRMVLYGRKGDRADEIKGNEFEYDKDAGMVRAVGLVHIDLKASQADVAVQKKGRPGKASGSALKPGSSDDKILHATTSGLVYMEKLGVAATGEPIEFELGGLTGHAVGADYSSDSGVLMLHSAVDMSGTSGKRPVTLTAASAELDNRDHRALLTGAKYVSLGEAVTAEQATLHARQDGTLERIEAQGNVTSEAKGAKLISQRADVALNEQSQPKSAVLTGGVSYSLDGPLQQRRGQADAATVAYDEQGRPEHVLFTGSVHLIEKTRATEVGKEPWSVRDLTAAQVDTALVPLDARRSQMRDVEANGNAHLTIVNNGSLASRKSEGRTDLAADDLKAHLIVLTDPKARPELDTIAGRGHTSLHQVSADGREQMSTGDTLDAKFRHGALEAQTAGSDVGRQASEILLSAVQQGHVTMSRRVPAKLAAKVGAKPSAHDDVEDASAERATYDGDLDRVMLTGGVQFTDAGSVVWANQLALDHKTGDAQAEGTVKVNYVRDSSLQASAGKTGSTPAEPTHILADRADLKHATSIATFYGKPVRLWQGANQVQAPVIEFARDEKRLTARADAPVAQQEQVHTVLVKAESDKPRAAKPTADRPAKAKFGSPKTGPGKAAGAPSVVRITSGGLVYSGTLNQANFSGGVRAESADGTILANEATVFLQSANVSQTGGDSQTASVAKSSSSSESSGADLSLDGRIERVVAAGHVDIEQPGRRATGERLVYTVSDQLSVLTGSKDAPPKVVDTVRHTTVTGAALLFHSDDESVEALSTVPGETSTGQRVHTDTEVNKKLSTKR